MAACPARHKGIEAPPVQQKDGLLFFRQVFPQGIGERGAEDAAVAPLQLAVHVDDVDFRQLCLAVPPGQHVEGIAAGLRVIIGLDRRRGGREDQQCPVVRAPVFRDVPRVVAGGGLRFVGALLLLVHHDEADVAQRGENRRPRAHHDGGVAVADPLPLVHALGQGQPAVEDRHAGAEPPPEQRHGLRRERDFRHHHDHAAPVRADPVDHPHEDRRLPAARHPVQQRDPAFAGAVLPVKAVERGPLLFRKGEVLRGRRGEAAVRIAVNLCIIILRGAFFDQRADHGWRDARKVADLPHRDAARPAQDPEHVFLLRRQPGRFLIRNQADHLARGVADSADGAGVPEQQAGFHHALRQAAFRRKAQGLQKAVARQRGLVRKQGGGPPLVPVEGREVQPAVRLRERILHAHLHLHAGGEKKARRLEQRAERMRADPVNKAHGFLIQKRGPVEHGQHAFEFFRSPGILPHAQDHPLAPGVRRSERNGHTAADARRGSQGCWQKVIERLVEMIGGVFHRDLRNGHRTHHPFRTAQFSS